MLLSATDITLRVSRRRASFFQKEAIRAEVKIIEVEVQIGCCDQRLFLKRRINLECSLRISLFQFLGRIRVL